MAETREEQQWRKGYNQAHNDITKAIKRLEISQGSIAQAPINHDWLTGYQTALQEALDSL